MITAFQNNISIHFMNRLFRYINKSFIEDDKKELRKVKNDILNNTNTSDIKYNQWIKDNKPKLLPTEFNKSYYYDIKCNPLKYLPYMIYINKELEKDGFKQFHCFPLRTDIVPKYIEIDTSGLLEMMIDKGSSNYRSGKGQIEKTKNELWSKFFKLNNKDFIINIPGKYNIFNACISIAVLYEFFDYEYIKNRLEKFIGTEDRYDIYKKENPTVVFDYAHNPDKIDSLLNFVKKFYKNILFIFQPHGFAPTYFTKNELKKVFTNHFSNKNNKLLLKPIFYAGGTVNKKITSEEIVKDLKINEVNIYLIDNDNSILDYIKKAYKNYDIIIVAGARDKNLKILTKNISEKLNSNT